MKAIQGIEPAANPPFYERHFLLSPNSFSEYKFKIFNIITSYRRFKKVRLIMPAETGMNVIPYDQPYATSGF